MTKRHYGGHPNHDIIVLGASAGGVQALLEISSALPEDVGAAVFAVVHTGAHSPGRMAELIDRASPLSASYPEHGDPIEKNRIYVAPPDNHLLVKPGSMAVVRGAKENFTRPAVDPLFRSAALSYGPRVIGVVLTGGLDDGTAGLLAVKMRGGIAIVQDPETAYDPSMPLSALDSVSVDYCLPLPEIAPFLAELVNRPAASGPVHAAPVWLEAESKMAEAHTMEDQALLLQFGTPSPLSCPECGGVLFEGNAEEVLRFRCRVGHAYSIKSLIAQQSSALEAALWAGVRALEESSLSAQHLVDRITRRNGVAAAHLRAIAENRRQQANELRNLLETVFADASAAE